MLSLGAKGADVSRRLVNKPVPNHFVLSFKTLAAFGTIACLDGTIVRSLLGMDVHVGALIISMTP